MYIQSVIWNVYAVRNTKYICNMEYEMYMQYGIWNVYAIVIWKVYVTRNLKFCNVRNIANSYKCNRKLTLSESHIPHDAHISQSPYSVTFAPRVCGGVRSGGSSGLFGRILGFFGAPYKFWNVSCIVILRRRDTRALTFEKFCLESCGHRRRRIDSCAQLSSVLRRLYM